LWVWVRVLGGVGRGLEKELMYSYPRNLFIGRGGDTLFSLFLLVSQLQLEQNEVSSERKVLW
jgi:hypothetical protein